MTDAFPWQAEGSDKNPATGPTDPFESLGLTFSEQSSAQPDQRHAAPTTSTGYADVATAALVPIDSSHTTAIAPMSRRALRDAERARPVEPNAVVPVAPPVAPSSIATEPPTYAPPSAPAWASAPPPSAAAFNEAASAWSSAPAGASSSVPPSAPTSRRAASRRPASTGAASTGPSSTGAAKQSVPLRRRIAQKTFPPVVMLATAALLVGTSVPATALFDPDAPPGATTMATLAVADAVDNPELAEDQVVEVEVEAGAELTATVASRDEWSVTSYAELLRLKYGSRDFSYSTTGSGAVRWPFPAAVPISSGFGERVAPCRFCSSYHQGLDFNPGAGTPIFAIADGVVIRAEHSGGFGNHAIIEHVINGQRVTSTYAHMTRDSSPLVVGQQILVGDFVGTVGSTGTSTGAHLHFEIRIDDIAIDPFAWLQSNAS